MVEKSSRCPLKIRTNSTFRYNEDRWKAVFDPKNENRMPSSTRRLQLSKSTGSWKKQGDEATRNPPIRDLPGGRGHEIRSSKPPVSHETTAPPSLAMGFPSSSRDGEEKSSGRVSLSKFCANPRTSFTRKLTEGRFRPCHGKSFGFPGDSQAIAIQFRSEHWMV